MATVHRLLVFSTCFMSGIAALFGVVSLATEEWITTTSAMWVTLPITLPNTAKYGLFQGYYSQQGPLVLTIQITMTCLMKENVCALLCGKDTDARYTLLKELYNNNNTADQDNGNCPTVQRSTSYQYNRESIWTYASEDSDDKQFINAGVWISTILFLVLSIALGMLSSALALWNTVSNPIEIYFSIFGLYIYNAAGLFCSTLVMLLWGIMHVLITFHNVGIFYTLTGQMTSDKRAYLGYSYWLNLIPIGCYIYSIAILYVRQYKLSKDPKHQIVQREDRADPGIYLY
ncbi:hypothetical protein NQ318_001604 [Aromia moschata]|uniref:Uncharacterized protein n=1 Tax=Aromia moschata TaxID=1265417 RepID=A0AAV8Y3R1_9CUCU|nr:hypothetical protein NQ318_001604 [Aromia moschata]